MPRRGAQERRAAAGDRAGRPVLCRGAEDGRPPLGYLEPHRPPRDLNVRVRAASERRCGLGSQRLFHVRCVHFQPSRLGSFGARAALSMDRLLGGKSVRDTEARPGLHRPAVPPAALPAHLEPDGAGPRVRASVAAASSGRRRPWAGRITGGAGRGGCAIGAGRGGCAIGAGRGCIAGGAGRGGCTIWPGMGAGRGGCANGPGIGAGRGCTIGGAGRGAWGTGRGCATCGGAGRAGSGTGRAGSRTSGGPGLIGCGRSTGGARPPRLNGETFGGSAAGCGGTGRPGPGRVAPGIAPSGGAAPRAGS